MKQEHQRRTVIALILMTGTAIASTETTVPKGSYLQVAQERLPITFCNKDSYFRSCFTISETECQNIAAKATASCLEQYTGEIPQRLKHPQDTAGWGAKLGACAGAILEKELKNKVVANENCKAQDDLPRRYPQ